MRRTKEEAEQTRLAILQQASLLFAQKGVTATSIMEIAKTCGLSRGALYWHFKDKWDIFDAIWHRHTTPIHALSEASHADDEVDPLGKLQQVMVFVLRSVTTNPEFQQLIKMCMIENQSSCSGDAAKRLEQWTSEIHQSRKVSLRNAIRKKQLPSNFNLELGSQFVKASIDGLLQGWFKSPEAVDLSVHAEDYAEAIVNALTISFANKTDAD